MLRKHLEFINLLVSWRTPTFFETLFSVSCICFFQVKYSSRIIPRNFKEFYFLMMLPFSCNKGNFKGIFSWSVSLWNNIYFAFSAFRDSLFTRNQSLIRLSTWFAISNRALALLSEQDRFVSSAKSTGSRTWVDQEPQLSCWGGLWK